MAGILTGQERSGTPLETRGGTAAIAGDIIGPGAGRLQAGATKGALGFDPGMLDIERVVMSLLADPGDRLQGLFAALEPFERRQTEEAVAGVRGSFGRLGGRFSTNILDAESRTRGAVAEGQIRSRETSLIEAQGQQGQILAMLLQAILQGRGQTLEFFRPGEPSFQEGILGDLIGAGGALGAAAIASSEEFKDGIRRVDEDSLALFKDLNFFRFKYKGDNRDRFGIILEDISVPDQFVRGDFADITEITFHLANAVKQLTKRIAVLES